MSVLKNLNYVIFPALLLAALGARANAAVTSVTDPYFDMFPTGQTAATYLNL
jgi:hypothetical protein